MNPQQYIIIAKNKICTQSVVSCVKIPEKHTYDITFDSGKCFSYSMDNVIVMSKPVILNPKDFMIESPEGKALYHVKGIYEFKNHETEFWHIEFEGLMKACDYKKSDLKIRENSLTNEMSFNIFEYLKEISELSEIPNETGEILLKKYYDKIAFVSKSSALSVYLNAKKQPQTWRAQGYIFPFGCNQSQYRAVKNALCNQISIIQGPPGTGKTQTILNIIANLIIGGKSMLVVSNNNSATRNVLEKLTKYGMDFMVATLGSADNKNAFIEAQTGNYPDLSDWKLDGNGRTLLNETTELSQRLQTVYQLQEKVARTKEKVHAVELESKHFKEYVKDSRADYDAIKLKKELSAEKLMQLWQELLALSDQKKSITLWVKIKNFIKYGRINWDFYTQDASKSITVLQDMFYEQSLKELNAELEQYEKELRHSNGNLEKQLEEKSLACLKNAISGKYQWKKSRRVFSGEALYRESKGILEEYPIVLSTTFSARTSLNAEQVEYDYVIMDEASQVDLATGALALSCAKNAVIVGDSKQLPNVVTSDVRKKAETIWAKYEVPEAYDFANKSFLQSVAEALPSVPMTLLREHYRCDPHIISFCNQKFYNNSLIIMTESDDASKALAAIKTVEGNHARGRYNQRQIDVIKEEIIPTLDVPKEEIGIIAPYNDQVNEIKKQIPGIDVATVHKFQGREKDIIILTTVDDQIKEFTDDPNLLNVAISRARKRLIVVVSGNEQEKNGNLVDLISYIQYNKMEVVDSHVYSVFDYLYSQYREARWNYLKNRAKVSQYDSENLTYAMLTDILKDHPEYGVQCFEPLSMIVRDLSKLSDEEVKYAMNPATHLDFMIFNKLSKQPVAAIETDGYMYHKEGTVQHERDLKKNHILELAGLKLIRLNTNGSNEKEKVLRALGLGTGIQQE